MEKILIISYFFPPCNLTAANRVESWAKNFHKNGLYPIVVTRNWDDPVTKAEDVVKPGGTKLRIEKHEGYEVHYLPHKGSLRDRMYFRWRNSPLAFISRILTVAELIGQNFSQALTPFRYLHRYAERLLHDQPEVKLLLISANPFIQFRFGYQLKKKHPAICWVADYRDDWTTSEINDHRGRLRRFILRLEKKSEKKWLSNAALITSVSPHYTGKISAFVQKPGETVYNGYDKAYAALENDAHTFTILYNGTLYQTQPVEALLEAAKEISAAVPGIKLRLSFPGSGFDRQQEIRIRNAMQGYEDLLHITGRIDRNSVITMQQEADVLIMLSHPGVKGIASSKFFEYLSIARPLIIYPDDADILNRIVSETAAGWIAEDADVLKEKLLLMARSKLENGNTAAAFTEKRAIEAYSRENQAAKLARLLLCLCK